MITYRFQGAGVCPADNGLDQYTVEIRSQRMLRCEDILEAFERLVAKPIYQEDLTKRLSNDLRASVTVHGSHYGVEVVSVESF